MAADLHMRPFGPDRPVWEFCFVTGLPGGRVALVERVHHAMADGVSGVDVATVLLDVDPGVKPAKSSPWQPAPAPSAGRLALESLAEQARAIGRLIGGALRPLTNPGTLAGPVADVARAVSGLADHGLIAPRSSLNQPAGRDRKLAFVREELNAVKAAGRVAGATVNDIVLSAVAGGLRSLLLGRGEPLPHDLRVKVMVPVSLRDDGDRRTLGNRVAALLVPLPVGIGDPRARLSAVASMSAAMKKRREVTTSKLLLGAADLVPAPLVAPMSGLLSHQPLVNLVVTNVPGPPFPLYAMGAEMLEAFPIVPLAGNLTLGVAALSYNGALSLGVTADADTCPDVAVFVAGFEDSLARLGDLVDRAADAA